MPATCEKCVPPRFADPPFVQRLRSNDNGQLEFVLDWLAKRQALTGIRDAIQVIQWVASGGRPSETGASGGEHPPNGCAECGSVKKGVHCAQCGTVASSTSGGTAESAYPGTCRHCGGGSWLESLPPRCAKCHEAVDAQGGALRVVRRLQTHPLGVGRGPGPVNPVPWSFEEKDEWPTAINDADGDCCLIDGGEIDWDDAKAIVHRMNHWNDLYDYAEQVTAERDALAKEVEEVEAELCAVSQKGERS